LKQGRPKAIMVPVPSPSIPASWDSAQRPFTITEVAGLFGVSVQAVHMWMKSGRLRRRTRTSKKGNYRIPRSEVIRLLESAGREVPGLWERTFAKVLVIDDDTGVRKLVLAAGRNPAFPMTVETAPSVEDGVLLAGRFLPDVILLDTFLSKNYLSGLEGLAFIRHATLIQKVKVIALVDHSRMAARFLKGGADDVLEKPFGLADLRSAVYRTLKSTPRPAIQGRDAGRSLLLAPKLLSRKDRSIGSSRSSAALTPPLKS